MKAAAPKSPSTEPVTRCPVCESGDHRLRFRSPDRLHGVPGEFSYRACGTCGSVFQAPRIVPEDLHLAYPQDYYTHDKPAGDAPLPGAVGRGIRDEIRRRVRAAVQPDQGHGVPGILGRALAVYPWIRERAFNDLAFDEMIPRRLPPGRALDVGCGAGGLLSRLALLGWEVEGVEWDEKAAAVARAAGYPVHIADAADLSPDLGLFRLIVLNHVFEHLPHPAETLTGLARCLEPGGRIVLIYPNCGSLGAHRFGSYWFGWEVPRHLVMPSVLGLRLLAGQVGLSVRSVRTLPRSAAAHSAFSRAYGMGEAVDVENRRATLADRGFGALEGLMVGLGAPVGEVILASLESRGSPG